MNDVCAPVNVCVHLVRCEVSLTVVYETADCSITSQIMCFFTEMYRNIEVVVFMSSSP